MHVNECQVEKLMEKASSEQEELLENTGKKTVKKLGTVGTY
jgi:hypothetical protein